MIKLIKILVVLMCVFIQTPVATANENESAKAAPSDKERLHQHIQLMKKLNPPPPENELLEAQIHTNNELLKKIEAKWNKTCQKLDKDFYYKLVVKQRIITMSDISEEMQLQKYKALETTLRGALEIAEQCTKEAAL